MIYPSTSSPRLPGGWPVHQAALSLAQQRRSREPHSRPPSVWMPCQAALIPAAAQPAVHLGLAAGGGCLAAWVARQVMITGNPVCLAFYSLSDAKPGLALSAAVGLGAALGTVAFPALQAVGLPAAAAVGAGCFGLTALGRFAIDVAAWRACLNRRR